MPQVSFSSTFTADKIDKTNAVIRGVSVITGGITARGHDLEVDDKTLRQLMMCAQSTGQVPVKVNHKSGADAVCGYLENFSIDGNKLKADWFLLQSHPQKEQILEVAERMPRGVGLSAAFIAPEVPEKTSSGKSAARCQELISVDYVALPAANPNGMFDARVDNIQTPMNQPNNAPIPADGSQDSAATIKQLQEQLQQLQEHNQRLEAQIELRDNPPTLEELNEASDEELAQLGITREEVNEAMEAAQAQGDDGVEGEAGEGELAPAGAASEGSEGGATGLQAKLIGVIQELSARLDRIEGRETRSREQVLFGEVNEKVDALIAENEALRASVQRGGKAVSPSNGGMRYFSRDGEKGEFESLVDQAVASGKTKSVAFSAVIKTNPRAYVDYQLRSGIINQADANERLQQL